MCTCAPFDATVFYLKNWFFTLLALATQFVAMILYALSFLPDGVGLGLMRRLVGF